MQVGVMSTACEIEAITRRWANRWIVDRVLCSGICRPSVLLDYAELIEPTAFSGPYRSAAAVHPDMRTRTASSSELFITQVLRRLEVHIIQASTLHLFSSFVQQSLGAVGWAMAWFRLSNNWNLYSLAGLIGEMDQELGMKRQCWRRAHRTEIARKGICVVMMFSTCKPPELCWVPWFASRPPSLSSSLITSSACSPGCGRRAPIFWL